MTDTHLIIALLGLIIGLLLGKMVAPIIFDWWDDHKLKKQRDKFDS